MKEETAISILRKIKKRKGAAVTALCYVALLLAWLGWSLFAFGYDRQQTTTNLSMEQGEILGMEQLADGSWNTTTDDPQILFHSLQTGLRQVLLQGEFLNASGEVDAYFTRSPEEGFSSRQRVWGRQQEDGSVLFALPPGQVYSLRLDPGSAPGVGIKIQQIVLNPPTPFGVYFQLSFYQIALFVFVPALASCGICTIIEIMQIGKNNRPATGQAKEQGHGK